MTLRTVRVPEQMRALFERAEEVVSSYFSRSDTRPTEGTIEIFDQRYLLIRAASLSVEFFRVVRDLLGPGRDSEADDFSRNILFDLAHTIGKSDARNFHAKMGLEEPMEKLSAGPVHFAHAGWAFVDILEESSPESNEDFFLVYDHPYSFESDAWLRARQPSAFPVCIMNAGYSSGWCEESFGMDLVASEVLCRACDDERCRFVMAPPSRIEERVASYLKTNARAPSSLPHQIPDLFARKRLEDDLRRAHDELERRVLERTEELRWASEKLAREMEERAAIEQQLVHAQKLEGLGRLASGIAHDFNNLLTVMNGCSEILSEDLGANPRFSEILADLSHAGQRARALTQQLLVFARQDVTEAEIVDPGQVIATMTTMLRRLLGEGVELVSNLAAERYFIRINPARLEQAILNLVVNARDAIQDSGTITLEIDLEGDDRVALTVRDTGVGMDSATTAHIFEPFFSTKRRDQGTGLGLSIVYGVVQQAGGTIDVSSTPGVGTTFTLMFPRLRDAPDPADPKPPSPGGTPIWATVLLVEDEPAVRGMVKRWLVERGHRVLEAADAHDARRIVAQQGSAIDLLISDVIMPGESGPDLARWVQDEHPDIRVILVSGYSDDRIRRAGVDLSRARFLQKPFELSHLHDVMTSLFEGN